MTAKVSQAFGIPIARMPLNGYASRWCTWTCCIYSFVQFALASSTVGGYWDTNRGISGPENCNSQQKHRKCAISAWPRLTMTAVESYSTIIITVIWQLPLSSYVPAGVIRTFRIQLDAWVAHKNHIKNILRLMSCILCALFACSRQKRAYKLDQRSFRANIFRNYHHLITSHVMYFGASFDLFQPPVLRASCDENE